MLSESTTMHMAVWTVGDQQIVAYSCSFSRMKSLIRGRANRAHQLVTAARGNDTIPAKATDTPFQV